MCVQFVFDVAVSRLACSLTCIEHTYLCRSPFLLVLCCRALPYIFGIVVWVYRSRQIHGYAHYCSTFVPGAVVASRMHCHACSYPGSRLLSHFVAIPSPHLLRCLSPLPPTPPHPGHARIDFLMSYCALYLCALVSRRKWIATHGSGGPAWDAGCNAALPPREYSRDALFDVFNVSTVFSVVVAP